MNAKGVQNVGLGVVWEVGPLFCYIDLTILQGYDND